MPELRVHPRDGDLIIATHGRGMYIMDDITPIRELAQAMKADAFLFDIRPAIRWQTWGRDNPLGSKEWTGDNPPYGAIVNFYVTAAGPVDDLRWPRPAGMSFGRSRQPRNPA